MLKARYRIYSSAILNAPLPSVWEEMRDFLRVLRAAFGDQISDARWIEGGTPDKIPSRYEFRFQPTGVLIQEEMVARSEVDYTFKYRTVGVVLSLVDYVGTFELLPVTDEPQKTFLATTKEFSLVEGTDAEAFLRSYEELVHQETRNMREYFARRSSV